MSEKEFFVERNGEQVGLPDQLPLLPLRDVVVFPYMVTPLLVGRPSSIAAVEAAMDRSKYLCVVAQREPDTEEPGAEDLFTVGTVIKVLQIIRTPDETLKILVEGVARVAVNDYFEHDEFQELARDVAMHVAASDPFAVSKEDVPEEIVARERDIFMAQAAEEGKPEHIAEKIIEGKLRKFFEENSLLQQPFIKDTDKTVEQLVTETSAKTGEKIEVARFARFQVGEGN